MKGGKPFRSRFKRAFVAFVAVLGIGAGTAGINTLPRNPDTDTQKITTFRTDHGLKGYNISPTDQLWKATLGMKSDQQKGSDLVQAALNGDSWRVKALFEHGQKAASDDAQRALVVASVRGDQDVVKALLDNGVSATAYESLAFRYAAAAGNVGVMQQLVNAGADVAAVDNEALLLASAEGNNAAVQFILQQQQINDDFLNPGFTAPAADVHARGDEALQFAVLGGYTDVVRTLLDNGADVNAANGAALTVAAFEGDTPMANLLLSRGANVNANDGAALYTAVALGDTQMAQLLVNNNADPSLRGGKITAAAQTGQMKQILNGGNTGNGGVTPPSFDFGPPQF